ncbi:unnamed protein product, partial [Urochloa humidicola]
LPQLKSKKWGTFLLRRFAPPPCRPPFLRSWPSVHQQPLLATFDLFFAKLDSLFPSSFRPEAFSAVHSPLRTDLPHPRTTPPPLLPSPLHPNPNLRNPASTATSGPPPTRLRRSPSLIHPTPPNPLSAHASPAATRPEREEAHGMAGATSLMVATASLVAATNLASKSGQRESSGPVGHPCRRDRRPHRRQVQTRRRHNQSPPTGSGLEQRRLLPITPLAVRAFLPIII